MAQKNEIKSAGGKSRTNDFMPRDDATDEGKVQVVADVAEKIRFLQLVIPASLPWSIGPVPPKTKYSTSTLSLHRMNSAHATFPLCGAIRFWFSLLPLNVASERLRSRSPSDS